MKDFNSEKIAFILAYIIRIVACSFRNDMFKSIIFYRIFQFFDYTILLIIWNYMGFKYDFIGFISSILFTFFAFFILNVIIEKSLNQNSNV